MTGKNIVICSDGTGNTAIKGRATNVFKLFEAVDLNGHRTDPGLPPQVAIYDDGVGTEDFKPVRVIAGATGYGLSRNVRQLYKELVRIYDPGDRIFLFGFSRGAFTVRTLAGLIGFCGIVDVRRLPTVEALKASVKKAYRSYRARYRTPLGKLLRGEVDPQMIERFRAECCHEFPAPVHFVGVWDTVDAVGLPFHLADVINLTIYRFKFPDQHLGPIVETACHALSVDDERHSFHPLLWHHRDDKDDRRIDQTWFAGAHSNVGGGYPKQGVSLVALEWMLQKAETAGLRLIPGDRGHYRDHGNVDDKVYDPRAGIGMFYRWKPRDIPALCRANRVAPTVHLSVLERIAHGTEDYAPSNLAPDARVVITPSGHDASDESARARARAVEAVLHEAHRADPRPAARAGARMGRGRAPLVLRLHRHVPGRGGGGVRARRSRRVGMGLAMAHRRGHPDRERDDAPGGRALEGGQDDGDVAVALRPAPGRPRALVRARLPGRPPHERRLLGILARAAAPPARGAEGRAAGGVRCARPPGRVASAA